MKWFFANYCAFSNLLFLDIYGSTTGQPQSSWSKGISETKSKQQSPSSNCMHSPVMSQANACTWQAYACMCCMLCPMMLQADACSYCMGSVVLILPRIYLYLQLLWANRTWPIGQDSFNLECLTIFFYLIFIQVKVHLHLRFCGQFFIAFCLPWPSKRIIMQKWHGTLQKNATWKRTSKSDV